MSRSRKKSPTHKKSNKALKQFYNRRLRRKGLSIEMGNFGWYKKANDSWELHDYIIRSEEYTEKDAQGYIDWKIKARNSLLEEYNRFNDCDWVKLNRPVRPYEQEIHRSYEGRLKTNWGVRFKLLFIKYESQSHDLWFRYGSSKYETCYENDFDRFRARYIELYESRLNNFNEEVEYYRNMKKPIELTQKSFNKEKMIQRENAKVYTK